VIKILASFIRKPEYDGIIKNLLNDKDFWFFIENTNLLFEIEDWGKYRRATSDEAKFGNIFERMFEMLLNENVEEFNNLRNTHSEIEIDLTEKMLAKKNLRGVNFKNAVLRRINLVEANLRGADISAAELTGADLSNAILISADLRASNMDRAIIKKATLDKAILRAAELSSVDLRGANLEGVDLTQANLRSADLSNANLRNANLEGAVLSGANLKNVKNLPITARLAKMRGAIV
jgi:uncharacterized protein YjbI with pentapeptide repeats